MNGQNIGESRTTPWVITLIDILLAALCLWGCEQYFASADPQSMLGEGFRAVLLAVAVSYVLCALWLPPVLARFDHILRRVLGRTVLLSLMSCTWILLIREEQVSRTYLCAFGTVLFFVLLLSRVLESVLWGRVFAKAGQQVFVCPHADNTLLVSMLKRDGGERSQAVFAMDAGAVPRQLYHPYSQEGVAQYLSEHEGCSVVYFPQGAMDAHGSALAVLCSRQGVPFSIVPNFSFAEGFPVSPHRSGEAWIFLERPLPLEAFGNRFVKRTFDIFLSLVCLLTFFPIIYFFVFLLMKLQSPGPVFVSQRRSGLDGRIFSCYGFRTRHFYGDAEAAPFPLGGLLRRLRLDGLPQLFCVLKGDMSFVGPRPHTLEQRERYREICDRLLMRHSAKPGVFSWSQVNALSGEAGVKQEIAYAEQWTIYLDICILLKALWGCLGTKESNEHNQTIE